MICEKHGWDKKRLPCPYLQCPQGARGLWIAVGGRKKTVYVRRRIKDEWGPRFIWEKTDLNPNDLTAPTPSPTEDEDEGIVF